MSVVTPPWTQEQADALNAFQRRGEFHPFTCGSGRRTDPCHADGEGVLFATTLGWVCPFCPYRQGWAHSLMMQPFGAIESWLDQLDD